jgi:hypothetical protein
MEESGIHRSSLNCLVVLGTVYCSNRYFHQQGIMGRSKNKNEPEPCEALPTGKCKCTQLWCKGGCSRCTRHCTCTRSNARKPTVGDARPRPEKTEGEKGANGNAFFPITNGVWCITHPKSYAKFCKTSAVLKFIQHFLRDQNEKKTRDIIRRRCRRRC